MNAVGPMTASQDIYADVAARLGGDKVFPRPVESAIEMARAVRQGLPVEIIDRMIRDWRFTPEELRSVIPQRTLRHRRQRNEPLHPDEADRAIRIMRMLALAERAFGSLEKANRWLRRPLSVLGGEAPLALAESEAGARVVESELDSIAWGAAA